MNLTDTDFQLFDVPARFEQDPTVLSERWKALQREVHPDRFAAEGPAAQRVAMQWAVRVNEAYRRLLDPLARGAYLCELNGHPVDAQRNTAMPAAFLMQQMEWRDQLAQAGSAAAVETLAEEVAGERQRLLDRLHQALDAHQDWAEAVAVVRSLMFLDRFAADVDRRLDALGQ
ncbi:MAG: Fe-S protein assembly co-chaperone HscB [Burkholderiaceae bacterium]|nr:Fe-S protein assembly co-chaperone HscB [Burkholderiaceae bacterium]